MASRQIHRCDNCHNIFLPKSRLNILCPSCTLRISHDEKISDTVSHIFTQLSPQSSDTDGSISNKDSVNNSIIEIIEVDEDSSGEDEMTIGNSISDTHDVNLNEKVESKEESDTPHLMEQRSDDTQKLNITNNKNISLDSRNSTSNSKENDISTATTSSSNTSTQEKNAKDKANNRLQYKGSKRDKSMQKLSPKLKGSEYIQKENHHTTSSRDSQAEITTSSSSSSYQKKSIQSDPTNQSKKAHTTNSPPKENNNTSSKNKMLEKNYDCFICGHHLSSDTLKGRINHIKRCAKKYNVSARDLKLNEGLEEECNILKNDDESDDDLDENGFPRILDENSIITIDDEEDSKPNNMNELLMSNAKKLAQLKKQKEVSNKQKPSLNNVLMDNARKLAQEKKSSSKKRRGDFRGRGSSNSKFSKVSNTQCPSYKLIAGTQSFICDGFQYASKQLSTTYFLTHFHYDHYGGLTSKWDIGRIYCSTPTANLLEKQLSIKKEYIHPLPLNKRITITCSDGKDVIVTLLDANHCPGAVMFLFELSNKRRILHVGDFRWDRKKMMPVLSDFISLKYRLDDIYLDTTYCDEKYMLLPSQDEVIHASIGAVERILDGNNNPLLLFGSYSIGKERIYLAVAKHLNQKVYVDKRRYKMLSLLNLSKSEMDLLTTNQNETFLWVVPLGHINFTKLKEYSETNSMKYDMIVGVRPTGWAFDSKKDEVISERRNKSICILDVPYSEHSSFAEIVDCLKCLKPRKIIPTVNVRRSQEQIDLLLNAVNERR